MLQARPSGDLQRVEAQWELLWLQVSSKKKIKKIYAVRCLQHAIRCGQWEASERSKASHTGQLHVTEFNTLSAHGMALHCSTAEAAIEGCHAE